MEDIKRQLSETDLLRKRLEEGATALRGRRTPRIPRDHKDSRAGSTEGQRLLDINRSDNNDGEMNEENREGVKRSHSNIVSETTSTATSASSSGIEITERLEELSLTDDKEFPELRKRTQKEEVPTKNPRNTGARPKANIFKPIAAIITQSSLPVTPTMAETMAPTITRELKLMTHGAWRDGRKDSEESDNSTEDSDEEVRLIENQARMSERAMAVIENYKHNEKLFEKKIDDQEETIKDLQLRIIQRQEDAEQREAEKEHMQLILQEETNKVKELEEKEITILTWMEEQLGDTRVQIDMLNEELDTAKESLDASDRKKEEYENDLKKNKEHMEKLIKKNQDLTNKDKRRRIALENNNCLSRYVSVTSLEGGPGVLALEDEVYNQASPDQEEHNKQQRKEYMKGEFKRLEATRWPYPENFATHGDFYTIVVNHTKKLLARGHPQDLIAESLDNFLMSSKKAPKYGAVAQEEDTETLKGVLKSLQSCDIAYMSTTMEERFNNVRKYQREDWESYIARCKALYNNLNSDDPNYDRAKPRRIKEQFFRGARIAKVYSDKFMAQNDLEELVTQVIRDDEAGAIIYGGQDEGNQDTWKGSKQQGGSWNMTKSQPSNNQRNQRQTRGGFERQETARTPRVQTRTHSQVRTQQQNQDHRRDQSQNQTQRPIQREASVLTVQNEQRIPPNIAPVDRTKSAPKSAFRMPIGEEHNGRASFCLRCRQKGHTSMDCTFCRYCSYCDKETGNGEIDHTNKMHREFIERGRENIIARHRADRNRKTYGNK